MVSIERTVSTGREKYPRSARDARSDRRRERFRGRERPGDCAQGQAREVRHAVQERPRGGRTVLGAHHRQLRLVRARSTPADARRDPAGVGAAGAGREPSDGAAPSNANGFAGC